MSNNVPRPSASAGRPSNRLGEHERHDALDYLLSSSQKLNHGPSEADLPADTEPVRASWRTLAATARRLERMEQNIFGESDELAEDDDIRRQLGLPLIPKRRRIGPRSSREPVASSSTSHALTFGGDVTRRGPVPLQLQRVVPGAGTSLMPESATSSVSAESQGVSQAELDAAQRYGRWLEEDEPVRQLGDNELFGSSTLAEPLDQGGAPTFGVPAYTQTSQVEQSSPEHGLQSLQSHPRHESPAPHRRSNVRLPSADERAPRRESRKEQPTTRRGRKQGPPEIAGFPPHTQDLPADISLEDMCRLYPHHLFGPHLRQFIRENWTGQMIWDAMDDRAKDTGAAVRPWNKLEHRIIKERNIMADEERAARKSAKRAKVSKQSPGSYAQGRRMASSAFLTHNAQPPFIQREVNRAQLTHPYPGATSGAALLQPGSFGFDTAVSGEERMRRVRDAMSTEVRNQATIMMEFLARDDPEWRMRSSEEQGHRAEAEWTRRARRQERTFGIDHGLDTDRLSIEPTSTSGMLRRMKLMLAASSPRTDTLTADANSSGAASSDIERLIEVERMQLEMLQDWTLQLREQLQERSRQSSGTVSESVLRSYQQQQIPLDPRLNAYANPYQSPYQGFTSGSMSAADISSTPAVQQYLPAPAIPAADRLNQESAPAQADDFSYERLLNEGDASEMEWPHPEPSHDN